MDCFLTLSGFGDVYHMDKLYYQLMCIVWFFYFSFGFESQIENGVFKLRMNMNFGFNFGTLPLDEL